MNYYTVSKSVAIYLSSGYLSVLKESNECDLIPESIQNLIVKLQSGFHFEIGEEQITICIGIDKDEALIDFLSSGEVKEELKIAPCYPFQGRIGYSVSSISNTMFYLVNIAMNEHLNWSSNQLDSLFKDCKLMVNLPIETKIELSFDYEKIKNTINGNILSFNKGVSPLSLYLAPVKFSDGYGHHIEISPDFKISSIKLAGALGESVARFGDIATNTILRYFEESYKWHDHLILDVLVEQLNQTVNLCFKEHEQDLQRAMQHFLAAALRGEHPTDVEIESSSVHSIFSGKKSKYSNSDVKFLESFELLAASSDDKNPWFAQRIIANGDYIIDIQPYIKKPMEASISITAVPGREANLQTWLDAYRGQVVPISLDWNGIKIFEAKIRIDLEMVRADGNGRILQSERQSSGSKIDVKINNSDE